LPSAALGKGFAECNIAFAECLRHSAKNLNPVVKVSASTINRWYNQRDSVRRGMSVTSNESLGRSLNGNQRG